MRLRWLHRYGEWSVFAMREKRAGRHFSIAALLTINGMSKAAC